MMRGLWTALVTPMRDDQLDESAFRALVRRQLEGGVDGLVPCGSTGEAVTLTPEERERVIALTVEEVAGRVPVMAGVGSNDTRVTVASARRAEALGANSVLVVTPYYNKPPQEGLIRHFRQVAEAISLPVCVYNVPGRTGIHLEPSTVARLAEIPNIVAVKEATGNLMVASEIYLRCGERMKLLSGDDFTLLPFIAQGGHGVISVVSNVAPRLTAELVHAAEAGNLALARERHYQLYPLMRALFIESNPIPAKTALAMMGLMSDEMRAPLCPMSESGKATLRSALLELGLLGSQA